VITSALPRCPWLVSVITSALPRRPWQVSVITSALSRCPWLVSVITLVIVLTETRPGYGDAAAFRDHGKHGDHGVLWRDHPSELP
jgi:hypothetical protein